MDISKDIQEKAPLILEAIKKNKNILLHCHPSPDPDSVGSALATKFALEQIGKNVTLIRGDSDIPEAFMHFPGAKDIVQKSFVEINPDDFDLFISLDSASVDRISNSPEMALPPYLNIINIDHHATNPNFGMINLVVTNYPATAQILFDLFTLWNIKITPEIAKNLFMGIYTDTGGFKYRNVTPRTFEIAAQLAVTIGDISLLISEMENSNSPSFIAFKGYALNSVVSSLKGGFAMASVPFSFLEKNNISDDDIRASEIADIMRSVKNWNIVSCLIEVKPNIVKVSLRSKSEEWDVSKIAIAFGGGGHKSASGIVFRMSLEEAKKALMNKVVELYNL